MNSDNQQAAREWRFKPTRREIALVKYLARRCELLMELPASRSVTAMAEAVSRRAFLLAKCIADTPPDSGDGS